MRATEEFLLDMLGSAGPSGSDEAVNISKTVGGDGCGDGQASFPVSISETAGGDKCKDITSPRQTFVE
eukprot:scaffold275536_cov18-Tisochrysis_lutea.AAC.1